MEEKQQTAEVAPVELPKDKPATQAQEDFTTLDYVREIFLQGVESEKLAKKRLRVQRFTAFCTLLIMIAVVVAVIGMFVYGGPMLKSVVGDFHSITMKVQEADIKTLSAQAIQTLEDAQVALKAVNEAAAKLQKLDMDSLNSAISELTKTVENFGKIDIAGLNTSIDTLGKVATALANLKFLGQPLLGS